MRSFQESLSKFEGRGIRVVALSIDPQETTKDLKQKRGYTFTFLCDDKAEVIKAWDLFHPGGRRGEQDIARPADYLIDAKGVIRWVNLTENYRDRPKAEDVLKVIDAIAW